MDDLPDTGGTAQGWSCVVRPWRSGAVLLRSGTGWDCPRKMEASEAVTERGERWWGSVCK